MTAACTTVLHPDGCDPGPTYLGDCQCRCHDRIAVCEVCDVEYDENLDHHCNEGDQ